MTREEAITVLKAFMENPLFSDVHKSAFNIAIHDIKQRHDWDINKLMLVPKTEWEQEPCKDESGLEKPNNCEDAISRQAVLDGIDNYIEKAQSTGAKDDFISFEELVVKVLPSVTPKPKMGRWIRISPAGIYECSECGQNVMTGDIDAYRHCHGCGAKMVDVTDINFGNMSENPTGSNCTTCILDGTDACSRGAGRAVDGRVCEDFVGESED